jgi:hypothetical protein
MKSPSRLNSFLLLDSPAAAETADTNGTDRTQAFLASWRSGYLLVDVKSIDATGPDETYDLILEGKKTAADAVYTELARITLSFVASTATTGLKVKDVPLFYPRMRLRRDVGGTTPSILGSYMAICTEFTYGPGGTVL